MVNKNNQNQLFYREWLPEGIHHCSGSRHISAAPFATSVPCSPMATPIRASCSAGASFTPSPVLGGEPSAVKAVDMAKSQRMGVEVLSIVVDIYSY